eukprot:6337395-Amphidinium_carterae.1
MSSILATDMARHNEMILWLESNHGEHSVPDMPEKNSEAFASGTNSKGCCVDLVVLHCFCRVNRHSASKTETWSDIKNDIQALLLCDVSLGMVSGDERLSVDTATRVCDSMLHAADLVHPALPWKVLDTDQSTTVLRFSKYDAMTTLRPSMWLVDAASTANERPSQNNASLAVILV